MPCPVSQVLIPPDPLREIRGLLIFSHSDPRCLLGLSQGLGVTAGPEAGRCWQGGVDLGVRNTGWVLVW